MHYVATFDRKCGIVSKRRSLFEKEGEADITALIGKQSRSSPPHSRRCGTSVYIIMYFPKLLELYIFCYHFSNVLCLKIHLLNITYKHTIRNSQCRTSRWDFW